MIALGPAFGALLILAVASDRNADAADCGKLGARYQATVAAVTDTLRTYERCVAVSLGRNDCSGEFGDLELEQDRFEIAVADYRKVCQPAKRAKSGDEEAWVSRRRGLLGPEPCRPCKDRNTRVADTSEMGASSWEADCRDKPGMG